MRGGKWIRAGMLAAFAVVFFWLFYIRYLNPGDCAAAASASCVTQGNAIWIVPALLFAWLALVTFSRAR